MRTVARRRLLLPRSSWHRTMIAYSLYSLLPCLLLLTSTLLGLDPDKRLTQYMHTSWRIEDGSSPAGMYSITQTSDGFFWCVSLKGELYRFDGVRFLPWYLPGDSGATEKILKAFADHAGGLWVFMRGGVSHLKGGVVTSHFELEGFQSAQNVTEDADGSLWVVRGSNSVSENPLCHVSERGVKCFGKSDGIPISPINSLLADGKGGFWLGGEKTLIHWHSGASDTYRIAGLKSNAGQAGIVALALGPEDSLWVGFEEEGPGLGLAQLKAGTARSFVTPAFDGAKVGVYSMIVDRDGDLLVGTSEGIFRVHGESVDHYGRTDGLSSDIAYALFEDREGIVWAGTTSGIDSFRDPAVTTYSVREGLGKDIAMGVVATKDGAIWVANNGSLDRIGNGGISSIRSGHGLPGHQVTSMLEDGAGNLWVGVDDGLFLYKDGQFRRLHEATGEPLGLVVGIAEDVEGNIWAECVGNPRKLVRIRDFQVREEFLAAQIPPGRTLAANPDGGIWISTLKGELALFRSGVLETFPLNAKVDPISRPIIVNRDGSVLTGTIDGLVGLRRGTVQRMTTKNGLPCNPILSLIEDKDNHWWLYTNCGVVELADSELQRWWANPETVVQTHVYDVFDGARPNRTSFNSAACSPDGRVWFANSSVVQMVVPSRLSQEALAANTHIESVIVDRKKFTATENLKIAPHPRDLEIQYTSPTFLIPQRVKFRYRLDPYDKDWHEAGMRREAFYTDLPPGNFSFRVIAANSNGVWNEKAATLNFTVTPAYYQTNWFRILALAAFLALLWAAYWWRMRHLRHHFAITLEARVGERTRIARELHDTLLQSFHGLLLRFQTVSQLLPERPLDAKERLDSAIHQAAEAITEGRDAVQGLRDSVLEGNDLARAISTVGKELAAAGSEGQRPSFQVSVEGQSRELHPLLRDEVYKIAAEALRNAFRHAQAQHIEVEVRYDKEQFRLRVRDDGKGIDPKVLSGSGVERHYGLPGMRERATLMGAKLTLWSEVGDGTEVELRIPASTAYATGRRSSWLSRTFVGSVKQ